MAGARQSNSSEIIVRGDFSTVFEACTKAAESVGRVRQLSRNLGSISVRTSMGLLKNPMNMRISVFDQQNGTCVVSCKSEGFDGTIGLGSAGKDIDNFYNALDRYL